MTKEIITADANIWLQSQKNIKVIITSIPDMDEINLSLSEYKQWVKTTAYNLMGSLDDDGIIFFYQTNRIYNGTIIDKKCMLTGIFMENGFNLILSKIVLRQKPETTNIFRPTYTNLFAFSKRGKLTKRTPDVFPIGQMLYKNAMGMNACQLCIDYVKDITDMIIDPFCGQGSVLKVAWDNGFNVIGVDIDPKQTKLTKELLNGKDK